MPHAPAPTQSRWPAPALTKIGCKPPPPPQSWLPWLTYLSPALQVQELDNMVRQSQNYSATLQSYNTSLQDDIRSG
jgi:hypothetical protein